MSELPPQGRPPQLDGQAIAHQAATSHVDNALLTKILADALNNATVEARRKRRWNIFFKLIFLVIFILIVLNLLADKVLKGSGLQVDSQGNIINRYTAVIDVKGVIADNSDASAGKIIAGIQRAYRDPKVAGIVLRINSGGGSPVQSGYVYDEINRLRSIDPTKPIVSVIEDIGASGAYYIAAATDNIYADKASLVGSIGVTAASFGFTGLIDKIGIERRLYTSGEHKAFLDPFSPQNAEETAFWKEVLSGVHDQFIDAVEKGRGTRLNVRENPDLYSGLIWNGAQALEMGLIDGLGSTATIARDKFSAPFLVDFTDKEDPFAKMMKELGMGVVSGVRAAFPEVEWR